MPGDEEQLPGMPDMDALSEEVDRLEAELGGLDAEMAELDGEMADMEAELKLPEAGELGTPAPDLQEALGTDVSDQVDPRVEGVIGDQQLPDAHRRPPSS